MRQPWDLCRFFFAIQQFLVPLHCPFTQGSALASASVHVGAAFFITLPLLQVLPGGLAVVRYRTEDPHL